MRVPKKDIGRFAEDLMSKCTVSRQRRQEYGAAFKNLFLTGDDTGNSPAIFNNIDSLIAGLSSYLYSPVELRFGIDYYGACNILERAKHKAASSRLHLHIRRGGVDTKIEDAVTWALVKGKCFIKLLWTSGGLQPMLVMPEEMGVYQENLDSLDEQEAFVHTTYITPDRLWQMLVTNERRDELFDKALSSTISGGEFNQSSSQITVGGFQPLSTLEQTATQSRGVVDWLATPQPAFSPEVQASLIPLHELWVWDDERGEEGEWTTIQFVNADVVLTGELTHRNIFAEQYDPANKKLKTDPSEFNPLSGKHPFIEICPNGLCGYFWGRSEVAKVALLQKSINERITGINKMLRRQEDPPKFFTGTQGIKAAQYSMASKPRGYMTDSNPNAKVQDLYPELPSGIWDSLHEYEKLFDKVAGFTATMSGRGEAGVRSQSQAESLIRTASPRFKDRALLVERQVEALGGLALDLLKAHVPDTITAFVDKKFAGIQGEMPPENPLDAPPVPGQVPITFTFHDLDAKCKVVVDSHSSSPAFSYENEEKMFKLLHVGAIGPEQLLEHTHPPGFDSMLEALELKKAEQAAMIQQHPELLGKGAGKKH